MINTPRTDAETRRDEMDHVDTELGPYAPSDTVPAGFARQLERELAEAKQEIERLDTRGIHSCHDNCQRPNCVLRRELKSITEQRDRLAWLIGQILSDMPKNRDWLDPSIELEARAAVKGNPPADALQEVFVTYAHRGQPDGVRFRQYAGNAIPKWAVDIREESFTTTP